MSKPNLSRVFCDTSFFYACVDARDNDYPIANNLLSLCLENNSLLYTTRDIIWETVTLLRNRHSYQGAIYFLDKIVPTLEVIGNSEEFDKEAEKVFRKFSKDKKLSFCDALSYVIVTKALNNIPCLVFDDDFEALGLTVLK